MKTLTLLHYEFGTEEIPYRHTLQRFFGETNKAKFTKIIHTQPELSMLKSPLKDHLCLFGLSQLIDQQRNTSTSTIKANPMKITRIGLIELFGTPIIRFSDVVETFLPFSYDVAIKKLHSGELALNAFKLLKSQKAPYLVHVDDLVELMENNRAQSQKELKDKLKRYQSIC